MSSKGSIRPRSRGSKYHKLARRNKLRSITEDDEDASEKSQSDFVQKMYRKKSSKCEKAMKANIARLGLVCAMKRTGGDYQSPHCKRLIGKLIENGFNPTSFDPRSMVPHNDNDCGDGHTIDGTWYTLSKPQFKDCLGVNAKNEPMYNLNRMSFGMFRPGKLVCSLQGIFNKIEVVDGSDEKKVRHVPPSLVANVREGKYPVRSYTIVTAFTIEPYNPSLVAGVANNSVDEPIEGILTTYGYIVPYPTLNRFSVWFTGGKMEIKADETKTQQAQQNIFCGIGGRTLSEKSKLFAAKLLMGASLTDKMNEKGKVSYDLTRPIASYIDLIYLDEGLRVMRSSSGILYIFSKVMDSDDSTCTLDTVETESGSGHSDSSPISRQSSLEQSVSNDEKGNANSAPHRPQRSTSPQRSLSPITDKDGHYSDRRTALSQESECFAPRRPVRSTSPTRVAAPHKPVRSTSPTRVAAPHIPVQSTSPKSEAAPHKPVRSTSPSRATAPHKPVRSTSPKREVAPRKPKRSTSSDWKERAATESK